MQRTKSESPVLGVEVFNPPEPKDVEYIKLARELGVMNTELAKRELRRVIQDIGLRVYHFADVKKFLRAACPPKLHYCWKPLRLKDRDAGIHTEASGTHMDNLRVVDLYDQPVPYPVLVSVKTLETEFPGQLRFFVSDYARPRPDPFLLLIYSIDWRRVDDRRCRGSETTYGSAASELQFIVEHWDEPSFRSLQKEME